MKIAIIGSGAIGCLYGAYLSRKNAEELLDGMSKQLALAMKHVEMLNEELSTAVRSY